MHGLHASPFHGFSVEFSEHRKYTPGDDPHDIDWLVYAKTDKYYVKKFEAETNITGYLAMDLSESMAYTYRQELTKLDYAICLAAALVVFDDPSERSGRRGDVCRADFEPFAAEEQAAADREYSVAARAAEAGRDRPMSVAASMQLAAMLKHSSLVMVFSDLLADPEPIITALRRAAAWRARRDSVSHPGRSRGRFSVFGPGRVGGAGVEHAAGSRRGQLSPRLLAGD